MIDSRHHTPEFAQAHRFFAMSHGEQQQWQRALLIKTLLLNAFLLGISLLLTVTHSVLWVLLPIPCLLLTALTLASFFDVPSMVRQKKMAYLSPMLLVETTSNDQMVLHGGTLFDYWFVLDAKAPPMARKQAVLTSYLQGLLNLLDDTIDLAPEHEFEITTYFIAERTATRMGFTSHPPKPLTSLMLVMNWLPLMISQQRVTGTWRMPRLSNMRTMRATLGTVRQSRKNITRLLARLQSS